MEFNEEESAHLFETFRDFVEKTDTSENLSEEFEYEKTIDEKKSLTSESWKYYLPNYDEEENHFAYLKLDITYEGAGLNDVKKKLEHYEDYEVFGNISGYQPILNDDNPFCLNLRAYGKIFLKIIPNHTNLGSLVLDFLTNYLQYKEYPLDEEIKQKIKEECLKDLEYYVRDLPYANPRLEEKYVPNTIIHDDREIFSSKLIGKLNHGCRFLIMSSYIHEVSSEYDFDVFRAWTGHFKVLDVFKYKGRCQIALLHLPDVFWKAFEDYEFEIDLVHKARKCFIDSFDEKYYLELYDVNWLDRAFPIGLDENGESIKAFYTDMKYGRPVVKSKMDPKLKIKVTCEILGYSPPKGKKGKYPAPLWMLHATVPLDSIGWRMGLGESYDRKASPYQRGRFRGLFPQPIMWVRPYQNECERYIGHKMNHYTPWSPKGKPKYRFKNLGHHISKEDVIFVDEYFGDELNYDSFIETCKEIKEYYHHKRGKEPLKKDVWHKVKYTMYLNTLYYIIIGDDSLRDKLIETGDKIILFENPDRYFGVKIRDDQIKGRNKLGFALMEVRDEVARVYKNTDSIDWFLTECLQQ